MPQLTIPSSYSTSGVGGGGGDYDSTASTHSKRGGREGGREVEKEGGRGEGREGGREGGREAGKGWGNDSSEMVIFCRECQKEVVGVWRGKR